VKDAIKLTRNEVDVIMSKFMRINLDGLKAIAEDPDTPVMEHILAKVCLGAMKQGDHQRLNFFLDRLVGKVKDNVEITLPKPAIIERRDGTQVLLGHGDVEKQVLEAEILDAKEESEDDVE
jgi:hypothetical protein